MGGKTQTKADKLEAMGRRLRDLALDAYCRHNPLHDMPDWKSMPTFGLEAWGAVLADMLAAGWTPPEGWKQ